MNNISYNNKQNKLEIIKNIKYKNNLSVKNIFSNSKQRYLLLLYSKYISLIYPGLNTKNMNINDNIINYLKKKENMILNSPNLSLFSFLQISNLLNEFESSNILIMDKYTGILRNIIIHSLANNKKIKLNYYDTNFTDNSIKYVEEIKKTYDYEFDFLNDKYKDIYKIETQQNMINDLDKYNFIIYRYGSNNLLLNVITFFSHILLCLKILQTKGNFVLKLINCINLNKIIINVLHLLSSLFENVEFYYTESTLSVDNYLLFKNYKGIDINTINILDEILTNINKILPNGGLNLNYKSEYLRLKYEIDKPYNDESYDTIIYSIMKIYNKDEKFKKFIKKIQEYFEDEKKLNKQYKNLYNNKLIYQDDKYIEEYIETLLTNNLQYSINYCKKCNIAINPIYLKGQKKYEELILNQTITMPRNLIINLLNYETIIDRNYKYNINNKKYNNKQKQVIFIDNNIKKNKLDTMNFKYDNTHKYTYDIFKEILAELNIYKIAIDSKKSYDKYGKLKQNHLETSEEYRQVTMFINLPRGIIYYIKNKYKINVTRAFIKMYEILYDFKLIDFNSNQLNTFHTCELPGHFINATNHYIKSNKPNMKFNWYANSLNPNEEKNKIKYNQEIFGDNYGFMSRYQDRWLFGEDNTGDITNLDNIKYFKNKLNYSIDLFTSDCGLAAQDVESFISQEEKLSILNYCQCLISLETLKIGGHGIYKIFLPMGSSVNISIIYLMSIYFEYIYFIKQFSGSYGSSEIYMVCKNKMHHLEETNRQYLYNCVLNYDRKKALFPKEYIDNKFLSQLEIISKEFVKKTINIIKRSLYYYDNLDILKKHKSVIEDAKKIYGKIYCRDVEFKPIDNELML